MSRYLFIKFFGFAFMLPVPTAEQSVNVLEALHKHVAQVSTHSSAEINTQEDSVVENDLLFNSNGEMIATALEVVSADESPAN